MRSLEAELELGVIAVRGPLDDGVALAIAGLMGDEELSRAAREGVGHEREVPVSPEGAVRVDAAEVDLIAGLEADYRIAVRVSSREEAERIASVACVHDI